jgi:hypothetical protein
MVPTKCSRDILQQAKGSPWSSPLRSDGSRDDQVGEASRVEQSSVEAKSLKTKGQGTVWLLLKWAAVEAARRGASGPNNGLLSWHVYQRKGELKSSSLMKHKGAKGSPPMKSITVKEKTLTLGSRGCSRRRKWWSRCRYGWMRTSLLITSPCNSVSVSEG